MNKKFRKLILPVSLLATSQVFALGLGNLQVNSSLDETLNGEIPIILDTGEDITNIKVTLASSEDYKRVGLDKDYVPANILLSIIDKNNTKYIEVSSKGPISEPIVSLLLSVDWANGYLLREYTILLDPPLFNTSQTEQNYSDPVQTQSYQAPDIIESENKTISNVDTNQSYSGAGNSQVVVESGDTLWKIAGNVNQGYGSQQQMMVALFNNNPSAFSNNDMNNLKKGAILNVPSADDVSMISNGDAINEVKSHLQNWSNLQTQDDGSDNYNSNTEIDYGIELIPPSDSDSSASNNASGSSDSNVNQNRAELNRLKEQLASSDLENSDLESRVLELEKIVEDQKFAMSLKDNDLAQLQQQVNEDMNDDTMSDDTMSDDTMSDDTMSDDTMSDDTMSDDVWDDSSENTVADMDTSTDDMNSDENMESTDDIVDSEMDTSTDSSEVDQVTLKDSTPIEKPAVVQEKSFMDKMLEYKMEGAIGLGALLLAILGFVFFRRKSSEESEEGGFLDSITDSHNSNDDDSDDEDSLVIEDEDTLRLNEDDEINVEEDLNEDITEMNLSDLDVDETLEGTDEEVPEVVVMDDQSESNDDISFDLEDDFNIDDLSLDDDEEDDLTNNDDDSKNSDEAEQDDVTFDLDIDDLDLDENSEELEESISEELEEGINDIEDELDLFDETGVTADESVETDDEFSLDLDDEDLDLEMDLDDMDNESEIVDVDMTVEETIINVEDSLSEDEINESLEFDLSDELYDADNIKLDDMDDETAADDSEIESVSIDLEEDTDEVDIGLDLDDIIDDDAIDTKLDLAKAYFEMGDVDGAKQMVTEIIEEGNDEQKAKAEVLRNDIENS